MISEDIKNVSDNAGARINKVGGKYDAARSVMDARTSASLPALSLQFQSNATSRKNDSERCSINVWS